MEIRKSRFSCVREVLTIRGNEYRANGEKQPIAIVSHGFMANQGTVKHYAREAVRVYQKAYSMRNVKYYEIEKGAHMFSKKHDKIAMQYLDKFCTSK